MNTIGNNIKLLRQKEGWIQADVAKRLKISVPAYSKIESGITDINIARLNQIANLFKVLSIDILTESNTNPVHGYLTIIKQLESELLASQRTISNLQAKLIALFDEMKENRIN